MAIAGGCLLELDGNIVLLKTPQTVVAKYGETMLELSWKFPSCSIAFLVLEVTLQTSRGKESAMLFSPAVALEANSG